MTLYRMRETSRSEDQEQLKQQRAESSQGTSSVQASPTGLSLRQQTMLQMQRTVGNAAVMRMLAGDVQRCGDGPCDCGCGGKEEEEESVQRMPDVQAWTLFGKDDDEQCDQNPAWKYEYDGCSVPAGLAKFLGINKDNPAGGKDTQFSNGSRTGPCDQHDRCYQTCNTDSDGRSDCDKRMYADMMAVCNKSSASWATRMKCKAWAKAYYLGLRVGGGFAWDDRQEEVCTNCSPKKKKK